MARRGSPTPRDFQRHPGIYARTSDTWTTRYYNRKSDPLFNMLGLDTNPDDFHKKDGSSPYLTNVRFMGEREAQQRAQVMSRKGALFKGTLGEDAFPRSISEGHLYINLFEGKAIEYILDHNKLLTGVSLHLYNEGKATGYVKITIRDFDTKLELANAVINTDDISRLNFSHHVVRLINVVTPTRVLVRLEILEDVDDDEPRDLASRNARSIRVLAESGEHEYALYDLPNVSDSLNEIPYTFQGDFGLPLTGVLVNDWEPMPRSEEVVSGGRKYLVFPVRRQGLVELYRQDVLNNSITLITNLVDARATAVRFAKAEGYLYYVDGFSPYRRVNLTTWAAENADAIPAEITIPGVDATTLTAKPGASLIHYLNNRIYLSGYKDDPNLVLMSLIDDIKPRFTQFNDRFYSPDQSPEASAGSPVTALASQSDYLIIFRIDGTSMYDRGGSTILEDASQVTPEGAGLGVLNQEAVCQGNNNIYFYNPIEGVQRFGGSVNRTVSGDIENLLSRIQNKDKVFMIYQNQRVRMYFSFDGVVPDSCLYYYAELEGQLPWYMDVNTPISSAVASKDDKTIYAVHSQVPSTMEVDAAFTDFDSYIVLEYHTQYRIPPTSDPSGYTILKRLHLHEIVDTTHSVFIGLDIDHQDTPIVWRRFVEAISNEVPNPDAVFQHTAEPGTSVIDIMMYVRCRNYQVRLKRYCYKDQGEVLGVQMEYGNKEAI
jgi:hypothetical protein